MQPFCKNSITLSWDDPDDIIEGLFFSYRKHYPTAFTAWMIFIPWFYWLNVMSKKKRLSDPESVHPLQLMGRRQLQRPQFQGYCSFVAAISLMHRFASDIKSKSICEYTIDCMHMNVVPHIQRKEYRSNHKHTASLNTVKTSHAT